MKNIKLDIKDILLCILELLIGILLIVDPIQFTTAILVLIGVVLVFIGIYSIVTYFCNDVVEGIMSQSLMKGLALLVLGDFCIFHYDWFIVTFPLLSVVYGIVILLIGLSKVQGCIDAFRLKKKKWFLIGISALISIGCAILIIRNPFTTTAYLYLFMGISLIVEGVFDGITWVLEKIDNKKTVENNIGKQSEEVNNEN
ncbi:MAG: HdeD family acid-resistance protein [Traorella sp.]